MFHERKKLNIIVFDVNIKISFNNFVNYQKLINISNDEIYYLIV